ncbi:hypothetical protein GGH96_001809 [Coemansia sp. RSA 1972]|nr:hypothetical protein GGH96_001809 [Coemansia sp. RSA 1972]
MNLAEQESLEAEIAAYVDYLEQGGHSNLAALALCGVIASGHRYLVCKFGHSTTAPRQDTAGANNSESEIAILESRLADADAYMRARRSDYADIRAKLKQEVARANRDYAPRPDSDRDALSEIKNLIEMARGQAAAADRQAEAVDRQAAATAAAESSYDRAKAEYHCMARSDAATVPVQKPNIFAVLTLGSQRLATSTHVANTTRFVYKCTPVKKLTEAICRFQDECLRNPVVARFVVQDTSAINDRSESGFVDYIVNDISPRVKEILEIIVGVDRVKMVKTVPDFGINLEVHDYHSFDVRSTVILPIIVNGFIDKMPGMLPDLRLEGLDRNIDTLRHICAEVAGGHNVVNLNRALSQTATYIEQSHWSHNHSMMFAKDCVVLLWRTSWNKVLVSHVVGYQSTRPHPAAAIAYWIRQALSNTSEAIRLDVPESRATKAAGHSGDGRFGASIQNTGVLGNSVRRVTRAMGANRRRKPLPSFLPQLGKLVPRQLDALNMHRQRAAKSDSKTGTSQHRSSTTTVEMAFEGSEGDDDPLGGNLDTAGVRLELVNNPRCGFTCSGRWTDRQAVIVKATPVNKAEMLNELHVEVRAYHRLRDLQGTSVPRVVAYGYMPINGRRFGILAVEHIEDEEILPALDMDERPTLKTLTNSEKAACEDSLKKIHRRGVVHGDIRGANLLFRSRGLGNDMMPVFIDFGFAQLAGNATKLTDAKAKDYSRLLDTFKGISQYA